MQNMIRVIAAVLGFIAIELYAAPETVGVTKKRLGSLKRDDLVVTDISVLPGGSVIPGGGGNGNCTYSSNYIANAVLAHAPERIGPYMWTLRSTGGDEAAAREYIATNYPRHITRGIGFCKRDKHVVVLDCPYDRSATVLVTIPASDGSFGVIGVSSGLISDSVLQDASWQDIYAALPFVMYDGMNDQGVVIQMTAVPKSSTSSSWPVDWHVRRPQSINVFMVIRHVLSKCSSAREAATAIRDLTYIPEGVPHDFHFLVSDRESSYAAEDGSVVDQDGIMGNFRVMGLRWLADGSGLDWSSVEPYGAGVERYTLVTHLPFFLSDDKANSIDFNTVSNIWYTRTYDTGTTPYWYTEYCSPLRPELTVEAAHTNQGIFTSFIDTARDAYVQDHNRDGTMYRGGRTLHSAHSVIYDKRKLTVSLVTQENISGHKVFMVDGTTATDLEDLDVYTREEINSTTVTNAGAVAVARNLFASVQGFANQVWTTVGSYNAYFDTIAHNHYTNIVSLLIWRNSVSNDLLLASTASDRLKRSDYFSPANTQLVATVQQVTDRRYALFLIDTVSTNPAAAFSLTLQASTSNFSADDSLLFMCDIMRNGDPAIGDSSGGVDVDWCRVYAPIAANGTSSATWMCVRNGQALSQLCSGSGYTPRRIAVLVDPITAGYFRRNTGREWCSESNTDLLWSYSTGDQAAGWRPIMPVRWYRELPEWAEQESFAPNN